MRLTMVIGGLAAVMFATPASADSYQDAIDGLMRASYRHMALTYACRDVTGPSQYRDARVAAENAARATGMPTDVAMRAVEKMAIRIRAVPAENPRPSLNGCTAGVSRTKQELLGWRAKFRRSQQ
ncbi:hypothetical protein [Rhizobium mesoamericanum]|uniref:hypothetical protein n=1 Tax=Rhizobium mesoamericanum TaxID=1079800 RepID=UPI00048CE4D1|nr:hypothetical protein [Rhizobium mesoamericanum]